MDGPEVGIVSERIDAASLQHFVGRRLIAATFEDTALILTFEGNAKLRINSGGQFWNAEEVTLMLRREMERSEIAAALHDASRDSPTTICWFRGNLACSRRPQCKEQAECMAWNDQKNEPHGLYPANPRDLT